LQAGSAVKGSPAQSLDQDFLPFLAACSGIDARRRNPPDSGRGKNVKASAGSQRLPVQFPSEKYHGGNAAIQKICEANAASTAMRIALARTGEFHLA